MSIASRITSIENHIENAYNSLNYMGETTTDKNIENIAGLVDNIYSKLPKVSNSTASDNVTLYPTLKGRIDSTLKGQIGQDTTEGNQLIDFANQAAVGYNFNNDTLTYQSSNSAFAGIDWNITDLVKNNPGKKLKFSYDNIDISNQVGNVVQLNVTYNDGTANAYFVVLNHNLNNSVYTISNNTSNISTARLRIFSNSSPDATTSNAVTIVKPQLQFGETALDYEKYTGGIPSPNPNYEQPVKCVTGENTVRARGINIAQSPYQSNNISTQYQNILFNVNTGNRIEVNKTYTISFKGKPGDKYRTTSGTYGVSSSATTITVDNNGIGIGIFTTKEEFTTQSTGILSNYSENNTLPITDICIAEGTFDELPFEPYYTPQEKELDLESENIFDRNNSAESTYLSTYTGRLSDSSVSDTSDYIPIDSKGLYFNYDFTTLLVSSNRNLCYYDENKSFISGTTYNTQDKKIKVDYVQNAKYIRFTYDKNLTDIKVYKEKYELYENGYFSRENGKWYLNNTIGKKTFVGSGTEYWVESTSAGLTRFQITISDMYEYSDNNRHITDIISNYFRPSVNNEYNIFFHYKKQLMFYADMNLNEFVAWLNSNNLNVCYPLATPSKVEITNQTLINQLEEIYKLMSYDGTTIIETECEEGNMPIIISASALLDSAKVIEDLETRIEVLESEE